MRSIPFNYQNRFSCSNTITVGCICMAVLTGLFLRVSQLQWQIVSGDEWWGLLKGINSGYISILSNFGEHDYSIPLTAYNRIMLQTVGLSEWIIRLPSVVAGLALLTVFPLLVHRKIGTRATIIFFWLLALSPMLVCYSRLARPYSVSLLLGFTAIAALYRWLSGGRTAWAVLYVFNVSIASYFLLVFLPGLLAPLAVGFLCALIAPQRGFVCNLKKILLLGMLQVFSLALLLTAPFVNNFEAIENKARRGADVELLTILKVFRFFVGTDNQLFLFSAGVLVLVGVIRLARCAPLFSFYLLAIATFQVIALLIIAPQGIHVAIVLSRYILLLLPIFLLLVAVGLNDCDARVKSRIKRYPRMALPVLALLGYLYTLPYRSTVLGPDNGWYLYWLLSFNRQDETVQQERLPRSVFYQWLSKMPAESFLVVEAPPSCRIVMRGHNPHYQKLHRQRIGIGFIGEVEGVSLPFELFENKRGLAFHNFYNIYEPAQLLKRGVSCVILHKKICKETQSHGPDLKKQAIDEACLILERSFGVAVYEDEWIRVYGIDENFREQVSGIAFSNYL